MKDGLRFVDSDMHIMEPPDLFDRYLDPKFKHRVSVPVDADGRPYRGPSGLTMIDGLPTSDSDCSSTGSASGAARPRAPSPLGVALADTGRLDFAVERDYNAEAQVMGMEQEGVDIAVLYPTGGLSLIARDNMDPQLSLALCQAYNNWIHEFCEHSPARLKFVAMLPCTTCIWPAGSSCAARSSAPWVVHPANLVNDHYWHSNYWDPSTACTKS